MQHITIEPVTRIEGHARITLQLDEDGRIEEVARMLGGVEITAITRQHAREMLGFS